MTLANLKNKVLRKLRKLGTGQTAPGEHTTIISEAYTSVYNRLKKKDLVTWTSTGDIPDEIATDVATLVAYECADDFNLPEERILRLASQKREAMSEISAALAVEYVPSHTKVADF